MTRDWRFWLGLVLLLPAAVTAMVAMTKVIIAMPEVVYAAAIVVPLVVGGHLLADAVSRGRR